MQLSIIIVNYNVQYFLEQALRAVARATQRLEAEVFVVDNNSVDDSVEMVRTKFPDVHLIDNQHNPGFSIANNQAIRQAKGKYILLLNPDTVVQEDTFDTCWAYMEAHPKVGALGVKMIDGSGAYLPESKRGFPSPFVAFCKTIGLSKFFPKSATFNQYYLGHLSENENQQVDVLAGAFMWMRKSVLDEIGLLDEDFFMYGEDIDLSYRVTLAGYENHYLAETSIIHYKGESTKKGSVKYVRTFYQAMILFAQKHFEGRNAKLFILMLRAAIYFRALLTLCSNLVKKWYLPVLDAALLFGGLLFLKNFWGNYHFNDPNYYTDRLTYFNFPLYILIWLTSVYFSGHYDRRGDLRLLVRGILLGSLVIAAVYGLLPLDLRSSRALIVLGTVWALGSLTLLRVLLHFLRYRNFDLGRERLKNLVIVGSLEESERVQQLLSQAAVHQNLIGTVSPSAKSSSAYLSAFSQLEEVVRIYEVDEIIFCAKNLANEDIMQWMTRLGPNINYKIVPEESLSIIGSHSKNEPGELYTIKIQYNINQPLQRRNKRLFDMLTASFLLLTVPVHLLFIKDRKSFITNCLSVLSGHKTWIGYHPFSTPDHTLPQLRPSVLANSIHLRKSILNEATQRRLDFFYAKDYRVFRDVELLWRAYRQLGKARENV
ncbi:MAG: glycosyltransferase family 2 protein [Bacteroidota bacterium]